MPREIDVADVFGWDPQNVPFVSDLPDVSTMIADPLRQFAPAYMINAQRIANFTLGRVAERFGMLGDAFDENTQLGAAVSAAKTILLESDIFASWRSGNVAKIATGSVKVLDSMLRVAGVYEKVPIMGYFVELGRAGIEIGKMVWEEWKPQPEPKTYFSAVEYSKAGDEDEVRHLLRAINEPDWTRIFSPPVWEKLEFRSAGVKYQNGREGDRMWIDGEGDGIGMIPGTQEITRLRQYNDDRDIVGVQWDIYRPALQQAAMFTWQHVLKNTPTLFRVNADVARDRWDAYYGLAEQKVNEEGLSQLWRERCQWWVEIPQVYDAPREFQSLGRWRGPDAGFSYMLTRRGFVGWILSDQLRRRQRNALNTLTVAYLTGNETGLAPFRDLWEERRRQLLEHPALSLVEFDMVPDGPWKTEARQRVLSGKLSLATTDGSPTMEFTVTGLVRAVEPRPILNLSRPEEGGGVGVAIAVGAGVALGAAALLRRRRRHRR